MTRETWTGSDKASDVLLNKIPNNEDDSYTNIAEVEAAASGYTDLDTRLDLYDVNTAEVVAARDGESSLLAKEQAQDASILAVTAANGSLISSGDTTPGFLDGKAITSGVNTVAKTSGYVVTASDLRSIQLTKNNAGGDESLTLLSNVSLTNTGASAEVECTLPAGVEGYSKPFRVTEEQYLKVTADGTETFRYGNQQSAAGGYIRSNVVGTCWTIEFLNGEWLITALEGQLNYDL
jgi:hypothetical protein